MVMEMRTVGEDMEQGPVKCFTEEVLTRVQPRTPFQELQGMNEDMLGEVGRKDCGDDAECSTYSWADFELELSDYERKEISPVVDSLLMELSSDFFFGSSGDAQPPTGMQTAKPAVRASAPIAQKSPKQQLVRTITPEDGNLIKAEYTQPAMTGQRCNLSSMMAEKSSLKRELRALDVEFEKREGRKPTKAEKEHLRPMYVRYWKLKHQISKLQNMAPKAAMTAVC